MGYGCVTKFGYRFNQEDFDPSGYRYMSFVPGRTRSGPEVQIHDDLKAIQKGLEYANYPQSRDEDGNLLVRGGIVYELVDGGWQELYHIKKGSLKSDLPWRK